MTILSEIRAFFKRPDRPEPVKATCRGCRNELPVDAVRMNGAWFCSVACWYEIPTILRKDGAAALRREADQLKRARESGAV